MRGIAEFSVKHSLFINLVSMLILIVGAFSIFALKREAFPVIEFDTVTVTAFYRGASAEEVEKLVTTPLEKELKEVDDIDKITSVSREGTSVIVLEISAEAKNNAEVVNDIQTAVDQVINLPEGVEDRPLVKEISSKIFPIINIALGGEIDAFKLQEWANDLKDRFEEIEGVAAVERNGYRDEEFWVEPDLEKMRHLHVSVEEIMQSLRARNVMIPGGKLIMDDEEFSIKTMGEFTTQAEIENVIIRANDLGNWLRVKDVARVRRTFEEETQINKILGKRSVALVVYKKEKGDAVKVVDNVYRELEKFKKEAPKEIIISPYDDLSYYIRRRLNVLRSNGLIGFILVILILFSFLHPRPALFTALGIPVAMCATLWIMYISGLSVNLMTMFGLIIVLGMVVDDGIIISENVYRYVEAGMSPREAAIKGTSEVIAPVTATVVTTIAAFLPLMFMTGLIGKFLKYIPLVVIIALAASVLEAFVILPSHLADFVKPIGERKDGKSGRQRKIPWLKVLTDKYNGILEYSLVHRYKICLGMVIALIITILVAIFGMPFVMFSGRGVEEFQIRAEAKIGTPLEKTNELLIPVEDLVSSIPKKDLNTFETTIGAASAGRGMGDPTSKFGSHVAQIHVYLTPMQQRDKEPKEIIADLRPKLEKIKGFERLYFHELREGPPVGRAVELNIRGEEFSVLREISEKIKNYLGTLGGISDIADSYELGNRELQIVVDKEKAAQAELSVGQIAASIRNAFEGGLSTTIKQSKAEEEIKVLVRLPEEQRNSEMIFDNLLIPNSRGNLVPLNEVAYKEYSQGLRTITHLDGKRYLQVSAEVDGRKMTSQKVNALLAKKFENLSHAYRGYSLRFGGEEEERRESLNSLFIAFGVAILFIFMVLATEFNSLVQPFIVLSTIPFALIGVVIALLIHNEPMSFLALIGIVGLSGVVVNDSIVLVDFINKLRQEGIPRRQSIIQAGTLRLRPVLLTTLTTVAGLSTVAYGIGGFDPFLRPMALSIAWGLAFATGLTLIIMPCLYAVIDDITLKVACHPTVIKLIKNGSNQCSNLEQ